MKAVIGWITPRRFLHQRPSGDTEAMIACKLVATDWPS
jgi:hypothetical protein